MPLETRPWDPTRYLDSDEAIAAHLEAAFEIDDPAFLAKAIGVIAQARGMTQIAKDAGISRESLYEVRVDDESPDFGIVQKVVKALELHPVTGCRR